MNPHQQLQHAVSAALGVSVELIDQESKFHREETETTVVANILLTDDQKARLFKAFHMEQPKQVPVVQLTIMLRGC